jgi:hypothetical protein
LQRVSPPEAEEVSLVSRTTSIASQFDPATSGLVTFVPSCLTSSHIRLVPHRKFVDGLRKAVCSVHQVVWCREGERVPRTRLLRHVQILVLIVHAFSYRAFQAPTDARLGS